MNNLSELIFALMLVVFFAFIVVLFNTFAIYFAWNGFLAPVFHLPFITKLQAFLAGLVLNIVFNRPTFVKGK